MSEGIRRIRIAAALLIDTRQRPLLAGKRGATWLEPGGATTTRSRR